MDRTTVYGRIVFAVAMIAFGIEQIVISDFVQALIRVPGWVPGRQVLVTVSAAVLILAGLIVLVGKRARPAAFALGVIWLISFLLLAVRVSPTNLASGDWLTCLFEVLAFCGIVLILLASLGEKHQDFPGATTKETRMAQLGLVLYGMSLPVFGVLHFIYRAYVASVIPAWIPGPMFWAYFTGIAHIAAGASIVSRIKSHLASILLAIMFGSWVMVLHIPRALAGMPTGRAAWSSTFVAVAMCGGALLIAGHVGRKAQRSTIRVISTSAMAQQQRSTAAD